MENKIYRFFIPFMETKNSLAMRSLIILLIILAIYSCNCPECFNVPEPFRLILYKNNTNLLDSTTTNYLKIESFEYESGEKVPFYIKDYIIPNSSEGIFHLEIGGKGKVVGKFYSDCIENKNRFYLKFKNKDTDTLDIFFEELKSDCCTSYLSHLEYNNIKVVERDQKIGAFKVQKK